MIKTIALENGVSYELRGTPQERTDEYGDILGYGLLIVRCTPENKNGEIIAVLSCYHGHRETYDSEWYNTTVHSLMDEEINSVGLELDYAFFRTVSKTEQYMTSGLERS